MGAMVAIVAMVAMVDIFSTFARDEAYCCADRTLFRSESVRLQRTASDSGIRHLLSVEKHRPQILEVNKK